MYSWIFKRIWRSMKGEARQRYEINRRSLRTAQMYGQEGALIQREDYTGDPDQIAPVADPNLPSSVMRLNQAMFVAQRAAAVPGYDHEQVEHMVLRAVRAPNINQLYPGMEKAKPLPNFKVQIEELKVKGKQMDIEAKKQEWANHLMEERRLNNAKIMELEAQAYSLMKGANDLDVQNKLKMLEMTIGMLQDYSSQVTERIGALNEQQSSGSSGGGDMVGMASGSGDNGVPGNATPGASPPAGAVG
jgi:hypothetical protein